MSTFHFELVSPERQLFEGPVASVVVPASEGDMTILPNHAPVMTTLRSGVVAVSDDKGAERRLASGLLKHAGGPLMRWCVPNLKIEPTATGIRATKQTAGDAKIDPAMAMFNAVTLMSRNPVAHRVPTPQLFFF